MQLPKTEGAEKKVVDRAGNTEYGVGLWRFMAHLERVVPIWMGKETAEEEETKKEEVGLA